MTQNVVPAVESGSGNRVPLSREADILRALYRLAVVVLAVFAILGTVFLVGRSAVYKIHEYERGLHLRGGRFVSIDDPGWHMQIPLVDTVIIVKVNERLGYVEQLPAMTADDVTMDVSLQYTYRVTHPERFALEVDDPERIVFEFVQGKLRDVVNTKEMADVMHSRAEMNSEVMTALRDKEVQYGVEFITVQIQSASPPEEVLTAIKDRMVASQRQEQAEAEAAQRRTSADAEFYAAQKEAEGAAYQIEKLAEADAQRIALTSEAQRIAIRAVLAELEGKGELAQQYIQLLIAQELQPNSKWIISGEGTPILDLRGNSAATPGGSSGALLAP
ncbi:MAG: SPFH domain-containing protein [Anaerolineae bacterium]|nr:SPFH domain-containing protein [Anaerolineae bacterium]